MLTEEVGLTQAGVPVQRTAPLRVLQVALGYFPYPGGLETHVHEVSRHLAHAGVEVTVLTVDTGSWGPLPATELIDGVRVRRLRAWPAKRDICVAPGLYAAITHGTWDIIHCQGIHTLVPPLAMFAAWRADLPYVVTFHSGGHSSRLRNASRSAQWAALRPLLTRAARLIAVSNFEAAYFQEALKLPKDRFVLIRNGASLPTRTLPERTSATGTLIVSVGRLERYKGHQRVLAALPRIREHYPDVRLLILGSGPYEATLRRMVRDLDLSDRVEIRMIPPGEREQMAATLARASLMTLLSDYEAQPIAVLEALALHCPVLVSDTSGFRELVEERLVRAVPAQSDPATLAAAVVGTLRDPLPQAPVTLPSWEACTAQLIDLYRDVLSQSRYRRG